MPNHTTSVQRYNKRLDKIWEDYTRREAERIQSTIKYIKPLWNKSHVFKVDGVLEVYVSNKHFAWYTFPYKNTRMEFVRQATPDDILF